VFGNSRLSPLARSLLAAERGRSEDEALKARAFERARIASEGPSGVIARNDGAPAFESRRTLRTAWLVAAAVAIAGLSAAAVGVYAWGADEAPAVAPIATVGPTPTVPAPQPDAAPSSSPSHAQPVPERRTPPRGSDTVRAPAAQSYAAEVVLLEPARQSLSRGDYGAALSALAKHRREYPNGQLVEEREALRVRALWGLGQKGPALAAAKAFRKRYPRSALLGWLSEQEDGAR
jgi:TolA-binding protein